MDLYTIGMTQPEDESSHEIKSPVKPSIFSSRMTSQKRVAKSPRLLLDSRGEKNCKVNWLNLPNELNVRIGMFLEVHDMKRWILVDRFRDGLFVRDYPIWKYWFVKMWKARNIVAIDPQVWCHKRKKEVMEEWFGAARDLIDGGAVDVHLHGQILQQLKKPMPFKTQDSQRMESVVYRRLLKFIFYRPLFFDLKVTREAAQGSDSPSVHSLILVDAEGPFATKAIAYTGGSIGSDRAVRANIPFFERFLEVLMYRGARACNQMPVFNIAISRASYFEVSIGHEQAPNSYMERPRPHRSDCVSIGLCTNKFCLIGKQPGWDAHSWGYHSDDGRKFHASARGAWYGPPFGPGDTVGCCLLRGETNSIFFTKNGEFLGIAFECVIHQDLYPVIGIDSTCHVSFNFGLSPFAFDVFDFVMANNLEIPMSLNILKNMRPFAFSEMEPFVFSEVDTSSNSEWEDDDDCFDSD